MIVSSRAPVRGHQMVPGPGARIPRFKSCPREGASDTFCQRCRINGSFKSCPREGASWPLSRQHLKPGRFKSCPREGASRHSAGVS